MKASNEDLRRLSLEYRRRLLEIIHHAGAGHTGGSLSCLDILTVLYHRILHVSPVEPRHPERDRYVQSKGHCVEALYVVLAGCGFFPASDLKSLCRFRSPYVGHPTRKIAGIEQNTGALGHGLSVAAGMAMAGKIDAKKYRVLCLLGDGELAEGSNWEAAQFAAHKCLDNLVAIIDHTRLQITGPTHEVMGHEPLPEKWQAFGWEVQEVDGHDFEALTEVLSRTPLQVGKPTLVLAHTIKGKGISFMENEKKWHHGVPKDDELASALAEIEAQTLNLSAEHVSLVS